MPVVVMRQSTPRWEGVELGTTKLAGVSLTQVMAAAEEFLTPDAQVRAASIPCSRCSTRPALC